jgi:plastocyanin
MTRSPIRAAATLCAAGLIITLPGCRVKDSQGDLANGKRLFVAKCGSCHILARAGSKGIQGPSLDAAFRQDRADGIPSDSIRGLVKTQILHPQRGGVMPSKLATGENAYDIASYVASAAAKRGPDPGLLAKIGVAAKKIVAKAAGGKLQIPTDPTGQLAYQVSSATASPGPLTIDSLNKSSTGHNISLTGPGVSKQGPVIANGKTSSITVNLKPGTYTFYCSVPGHRQAGMQGKLVVK